MKQSIRKPLMLGLGVVCLVVAAAASLLPILPGWVFFLAAIAIFAEESKIVRQWIKALRRRWPWLSHKVNKAAEHRHAPRSVKKVARHTDPGHRHGS